ncbi:SpoIIE family protein phosphatase [Bailinhaonella thermotolerans]|uniref:PAS domain-containing protein n=1 Tax=Bailinhaonella thermotolerans TaxID=1070861 RepID=A0A3A4AH48_9ACTN|nr:SpoIIE family protein phosphatase [Bailinhaonella thermotolerans]RJL25160.1 PAS domain-containing protein [Bailinhaonella thermotolerans]
MRFDPDPDTVEPGTRTTESTLDTAMRELRRAEETLRLCRRHMDAGDGDPAQAAPPKVPGALFERLPLPICLLDRSGMVRLANPAAAETLDVPRGELAGRPFSVFVDLAERPVFRSLLSAVVRDAAPTPVTLRLRRPGPPAPARMRLVRLTTAPSPAPSVAVVFAPESEEAEGATMCSAWLDAVPPCPEGARRDEAGPAQGRRHLGTRRWESTEAGAGRWKGEAETEEERRRESEEALKVLRAGLVPSDLPSVPGVELAAAHRPASNGGDVGGDFYDVYPSLGSWGLVLGDVSGKGVEAAVLTSTVRNGVRLLSLWEDSPAEVLRKMNRGLFTQPSGERFVTVLAARFTVEEPGLRVRYASAGHLPAVLLRSGGGISLTASSGSLPLGLFEEIEPAVGEFTLGHGETLVLHSDGITEARDAAGGFYGEDRLIDVLAATAHLPAAELVAAVEDDVLAYTGGVSRDDMAVLALRPR